MAKAWVLTPFEDADGKHEIGDEIELRRESDEEKVGFDRLLDYRIITSSEKEAGEAKKAADKGEPPAWAAEQR